MAKCLVLLVLLQLCLWTNIVHAQEQDFRVLSLCYSYGPQIRIGSTSGSDQERIGVNMLGASTNFSRNLHFGIRLSRYSVDSQISEQAHWSLASFIQWRSALAPRSSLRASLIAENARFALNKQNQSVLVRNTWYAGINTSLYVQPFKHYGRWHIGIGLEPKLPLNAKEADWIFLSIISCQYDIGTRADK
jgi:hypothetical protein